MMADLRMQEMFLVQREEETNCHANALQLRQVKLVEARLAVQLNKVVQARGEEMDEEAEREEEVSSYRDEVTAAAAAAHDGSSTHHSPLTLTLTTHHSPLISPSLPPLPPLHTGSR